MSLETGQYKSLEIYICLYSSFFNIFLLKPERVQAIGSQLNHYSLCRAFFSITGSIT